MSVFMCIIGLILLSASEWALLQTGNDPRTAIGFAVFAIIGAILLLLGIFTMRNQEE